MRLITDRTVPCEAVLLERVKNALDATRYGSWGVDIVDAEMPEPLVFACV
jgi:hypothetical protein